MSRPHWLATDLDGTLLPIDGDAEHRDAMKELSAALEENGIPIVFVTGRSFAQVQDAVREHAPPRPRAVICDVGTTIMLPTDPTPEDASDTRDEALENFGLSDDYHRHLQHRLGDWDHERLLSAALDLDLELTPQPDHQQSELKTSFFYPPELRRSVADTIEQWIRRESVPVSMTISVDPFEGQGLLDLLPRGAQKGSALAWYLERCGVRADEVVFAGDTGNDAAAMTSGVRGILVGNADEQLRQAAATVSGGGASGSAGIYQATGTATAGVWEGFRYHWRM